MIYQAKATINLSALRHNLKRVRDYAPSASIMAMIKANAYGHGICQVAATLQGQVEALGVARLEEALCLRNQAIACPIVVMLGFIGADELQQMRHHHIIAVVHSWEQLDLLEANPASQLIQIWIKVDTGLHRLGFAPEEIISVYNRLLHCKGVSIIGLMTHFAGADELSRPITAEQMAIFQAFNFPNLRKSAANSPAIIAWPASHADWVRPGIMLYGVSAFNGQVGNAFDLKPVMTLSSELIAIHDFEAGQAIGYHGTWVCPVKSRIGVAAIGYGDGYPRHAKNATPVLVKDQRCSLVGRVSMDLITIDLQSCPDAKLGDRVILWGEGLAVEEVAACADTIAYELFCQVSARVRFEYV